MGIIDTNVTAGLGHAGHAALCFTLNLAKHFSSDAVLLLFQFEGRFLAAKVISVPEPENCQSGVISFTTGKYWIKSIPTLTFIN